MHSFGKYLPKFDRKGVIALFLFGFVFETFLWMFPQIISIPLLVRFHPETRAYIADRLDLPNLGNRKEVMGDDGKVIKLYRPRATVQTATGERGGTQKVTMDENGFCNPPKSANMRQDILVLGDSLSWCTAVTPEETWAAELSEVSGLGVYNLAAPNLGPYQHLQILKKFGNSPRAVILALYEGNDLIDAIQYKNDSAKTEDTSKSWPCSLPEAVCKLYRLGKESFLGEKSLAINYIISSVKFIKDWAISQAKPAAKDKFAIDFRYSIAGKENNKVVFNELNRNQNEAEIAIKAQNSPTALEAYDDALKEFVRLSQEKQFIPIVFYIPTPYTFYAGNVSYNNSEVGRALIRFNSAQQKYLETKARELGFIFINPADSFRENAAERELGNLIYSPTSLHLTPRGHKLMANFVKNKLEQFIRK